MTTDVAHDARGDGRMAAASPPSYQRVFPPLLPPSDLPQASTGLRRSHRLLVAVAVVAVVGGLVAGASVLVSTATRSDDDSRTEAREQPAARRADPGTAAVAVDTPELSRVLEDRPTDGRLHGLGRHLDVVAYGYTDRVRLAQPDRPHGETVEAAEGERWLVVELDISDPLGVSHAEGARPHTEAALVADEARVPVPLDGPGIAAFSLPTNATNVDLVVTDPNLVQSWSFLTERRSHSTPKVLYRPQDLIDTIDTPFTLPYGATSPAGAPPPPGGVPSPAAGPSSPFGQRSLNLRVGEARLAYAVGVSTDGNLAYHMASGPDRALLYLMGINLDWGGGEHMGYSIRPEDAVLTLTDGTTVTPTPVARNAEMGTAVHDLEDGLPLFFGIFDGTLVWDVPADMQRATLTIRPSRGASPGGAELDFRGGVIEIAIDFSSP